MQKTRKSPAAQAEVCRGYPGDSEAGDGFRMYLGGLLTARGGTCAGTPGSKELSRSSKQGSQLIFGQLGLTRVHSDG